MDNSKEFITVKGAREHNLRGVDLQIPKGKLVVFSGVSGSGKSSMAMDTLYAEGQRRYVESLSSYARQFLGMMRRPDVDVIEGLSPAISIDQHGLSHNPRSTVGTSTEIYDYLRLLYARIGHPHCPNCGREISKQTGVSITGQIIQITKDKLQTENNARFLMLSPVVRDKRGEFGKLMENLLSKGFTHSRIDGRVISLKEDFLLIKTNRHNIDAVIDRISIAGKKNFSEKILQSRILEAVELALDMSDGLIILAEVLDKGYAIPENPAKMKDYLFSQKFACPLCSISLPEVEPRLFSFNSPQGACPECGGIGAKLKVDRSRISPWRADMLESQYYKTTSDTIREEIEKLMVRETCSSCHGSRLKKEALSVTIDGKSISTVSALSLEHFFAWSKSWQKTLDSSLEKEVSTPIFNEIVSRLNFLNAVGVEYLTLDRTASTLSVGEAQRIRLASQIGAGLSGVLYVLDEPTVGLHQRDTQRLIKTLQDLRDLGNTVIVVEHDTEVLNAADYIIDFGPLAGKKGGQIVAVGTPAEIKANRKSLTGKYLSGKKKVAGTAIHPGGNVARHLGGEDFNTSEVKAENEKDTSGVNAENLNFLTLSGCSQHNLKNISVKFPLNNFVCLTGVSGSGKSTLMHDTLYPAVKQKLDRYFRQKAGKFSAIDGYTSLNQVLLVDQSPIGRSSRSNPATYTGVWTEIRKLYAQLKESRLRGFNQGYFSFNTKGGRCEACQGQGVIRVKMQFLPDVWVECDECHGSRFKSEILEVEYKGKNISQILNLTINEAIDFFSSFARIEKRLLVLRKIGLEYLELGQRSPTLSGGESQRLKLARELTKSSREHTLYLLDEPTTGLHFADVEKLLTVIKKLIARGNSVVVIEHSLDMIKNADWVIDLGPEGGEKGGEIVAEGAPEKIAKNNESWTGKYLQKTLGQKNKALV